MKRYTVAAVRERLADALDAAEKGVPVIVERKGVRYRLTVEKPRPSTTRRKPYVEIVDPAVARGGWTWDWAPEGVKFKARSRRA